MSGDLKSSHSVHHNQDGDNSKESSFDDSEEEDSSEREQRKRRLQQRKDKPKLQKWTHDQIKHTMASQIAERNRIKEEAERVAQEALAKQYSTVTKQLDTLNDTLNRVLKKDSQLFKSLSTEPVNQEVSGKQETTEDPAPSVDDSHSTTSHETMSSSTNGIKPLPSTQSQSLNAQMSIKLAALESSINTLTLENPDITKQGSIGTQIRPQSSTSIPTNELGRPDNEMSKLISQEFTRFKAEIRAELIQMKGEIIQEVTTSLASTMRQYMETFLQHSNEKMLSPEIRPLESLPQSSSKGLVKARVKSMEMLSPVEPISLASSASPKSERNKTKVQRATTVTSPTTQSKVKLAIKTDEQYEKDAVEDKKNLKVKKVKAPANHSSPVSSLSANSVVAPSPSSPRKEGKASKGKTPKAPKIKSPTQSKQTQEKGEPTPNTPKRSSSRQRALIAASTSPEEEMEKIQNLLEKLSLGQYTPAFKKHGIVSFNKLLALTDSQWDELGVSNVHRSKIQMTARETASNSTS